MKQNNFLVALMQATPTALHPDAVRNTWNGLSNNTKSAIQAMTVAILLGLNIPVSKIFLRSMSPYQLNFLMYMGSASMALVVMLVNIEVIYAAGTRPWNLDSQNKWLFFLSIVFGSLIGQGAFCLGLSMDDPGKVSLWRNLLIIFTPVIGLMFFEEQIDKTTWKAVGTAFLGSLFLIQQAKLLAVVFVAIACLGWAVDMHARRKVADAMPVIQLTLWKGLMAGVFNLIIACKWGGGWVHCSWVMAAVTISWGVIAFGFTVVLGIWASQNTFATKSSTLTASSPYWGLLFSALILDSKITVMQLIASAIFFRALWLLWRREPKIKPEV